ncbi:Gfo/Idh/MocA family protein [Aspergillus undulatus]|uniref:Gfo/Idh/MocA family protein n=1 Tax=Aspergillus undulatus TaxID=1810928 RepID=UPI003CCE4380
MTSQPLRIGILASGPHPIQTIYLPALQSLPTLYIIVAIHTSSSNPETQSDNNEPSINDILTNPSISLILNFLPNEYHELYTIAALQAGKHVVVETPLSLSIPSAKRILDAEKEAPNGARVFVASARRYAPCFTDVFKKECPERELIGPKSRQKERKSMQQSTERNIRPGYPSPTRLSLSRFLASLGAHDLGLMRDTLGYPDSISNISVNEPFYSAIFHYNGPGSSISSNSSHTHGHPFTLFYEAGTDSVPRCDAQLATYGQSKTVTMHYDLPYARGQPLRVVVESTDERGGLMQTETVSTWEEAYQAELKALHGFLVQRVHVSTTASDGLQDVKLFQEVFGQYDRQCGTIRTPLG